MTFSTLRNLVFRCQTFFIFAYNFSIANSLTVAQEIKTISDFADLHFAPSTQLALHLLEPSIQKKLGVSGDAYDKLVKLLREQMITLPEVPRIADVAVQNRLSLYSPFAKASAKNDKYVWEVLTELLPPAEMDRLMGIHIGINGMEAILNRNIATRLQISDEQSKKISAEIKAVRNSKRSVLTELAMGKKPASLELLLPDRTSTTTHIRTLLDKKQQDSLDSMLQGFEMSSVAELSFGW